MDAVSHQAMGGRDAAGNVAVEIASGEEKVRCRQYGYRNPRAGQSPRGAFQLVRRERGKFRDMADRDTAAPLVVIGKPANLVEIEVCRVEAKIEMKIDIDVEATGEIEDAADLSMRSPCPCRGRLPPRRRRSPAPRS